MKTTALILVFLSSCFCHAAASPDQQLKNEKGMYNYWYPQQQDFSVGYTLKKCEDPNPPHHVVSDTENEAFLDKSCVPDVLYSWGDTGKLAWFKSNMTSNAWTGDLPRELFATHSPSGSFGYGPIAVRLKIKPGTIFRVRRVPDNRPCRSMTTREKERTIYMVTWLWNGNTGLDYILCSTNVIESWSYDTKEHYDEVVADANWVMTHQKNQYALYGTRGPNWWYFDQYEVMSENNRYFTRESFESSLTSWNAAMARGIGGVYYNKGVAEDRDEHFRSRRPIYFNPK